MIMIKATQHKAYRLIERYGIEKALEVVKAEIDALSFQADSNAKHHRDYWSRVYELVHKEKIKAPTRIDNKLDLIDLQAQLKDTLFVRPYDIEKIERAAIKLCDAIIDMDYPAPHH